MLEYNGNGNDDEAESGNGPSRGLLQRDGG